MCIRDSLCTFFACALFCAVDVRAQQTPLSGAAFIAVCKESMTLAAVSYTHLDVYKRQERPRPAMAVTVLRGFVFMAACFFGLPLLLGVEGIWLAVPLAEALTFAVVAAIYGRTRLKSAF